MGSKNEPVTVTRASPKWCATGAVQDPAQLIVDPEKLDSGSWLRVGTVVTADQDIAPDGSKTADLVSINGTGNFMWSNVIQSPGLAAYSGSIYLKAVSGTASGMRFAIRDQAGTFIAYAAPTLTTTWQHLVVSGTSNPGATNLTLFMDSTSGTQRFYAWGAKLEQASDATAYPFTGGKNNAALVRLDNDLPCVEEDGLRTEPSVANLHSSPTSFDTTDWIKGGSVSVDANAAIAPDGTFTADRVTFGNTPGDFIYQRYSSETPNTTYTCSAWVWTASGTATSRMSRTNTTAWGSATLGAPFTVTTTPTRHFLAYTTAAGETSSDCLVGGEGKTGTAPSAGPIFMWGSMREKGSFPTSFTTGTRDFDLVNIGPATLTATNKFCWSADVKLIGFQPSNNQQVLFMMQNGGDDQLYCAVGTNTFFYCNYYNGAAGGGPVGANPGVPLNDGATHHVLMSYDGATWRVCVDRATCGTWAGSFTVKGPSEPNITLGGDPINGSPDSAAAWLSHVTFDKTPTGCP